MAAAVVAIGSAFAGGACLALYGADGDRRAVAAPALAVILLGVVLALAGVAQME